MPDTRDPGAAIKRLGQRLAEEVAKAGPLTMRGFTFIPNMDGDGPDMVQAVFSIDGEVVEVSPEQAEIDRTNAEFEAIMRGDQVASQTDAVAEARKVLEARLAEDGGILDDEDDD